MDKRNIHVVPDGNGWATRREHADRASSTHNTQADAIERAREIARREQIEVVIHRPDGRIRDKDSYGNDPAPPIDKRR